MYAIYTNLAYSAEDVKIRQQILEFGERTENFNSIVSQSSLNVISILLLIPLLTADHNPLKLSSLLSKV